MKLMKTFFLVSMMIIVLFTGCSLLGIDPDETTDTATSEDGGSYDGVADDAASILRSLGVNEVGQPSRGEHPLS